MITKDRTENFSLLIVFLLLLLLIPSTVSASNWEQFQVNAQNTGVTEDKAPITYPVGNNYSWATQVIDATSVMSGFDSTFVVLDGVLYVIGYDNTLRALYMENGTEIWSTDTNGGGWHLGSIAAGNGSIFVPTQGGWIYCINSTTGVVEWKADEGLSIDDTSIAYQLNTPAVYDDHKVYFGGWAKDDMYGNLSSYCCYYDNGTKCWERQTTTDSGYYWTGAAVIDDYLVYADISGYLVSVYKDTGLTRDTLNLSSTYGFTVGEVRCSICYAEELGRIYLNSEGGYLCSIAISSDGTFSTMDKQYVSTGLSKSTPAYYNEKVYVGTGAVQASEGSGLLCFNASNLSEKFWTYNNASSIQSSPVISTAYDDGDGEVYIYFTTNVELGTVYCLNESGVEQWTYTAPSEMVEYTLQGVTISDGWLFYGNDAGYVFGLATEESLYTCIDNNTSLQDTIYAANDGDTIIMASGTYDVSSDPSTGYPALYINKSDLRFITDGGEVIIASDTDASPSVMLGVADADDSTGCDASGTTFEGITFAGFDAIGATNSDLKANQVLSSLIFEDCTFAGGNFTWLYDDSAVLNCTFSDGPCFMICGDNIDFEGANGTFKGIELSTDLSGASDLTIQDNYISPTGSLDLSNISSCLVEDNVISNMSSSSMCQFSNSSSVVINNEFTNCFVLVLGGEVYLNNIIDCGATEFVMASGTFNTSEQVKYRYNGTNYTSYLGNYYSDYSGNDTNADGIGDDPVMDSLKGGTDYYPLMFEWSSSGFVIDPLGADFSANITSGNVSLTVQFTDLSSGSIDNWEWDFDNDGVVDCTDQNPVFTYDVAGRYSVNLTVSNATANDSEFKTEYIYVADDLNPWNDAASGSGSYIAIDEVIEAYNCWRYNNPAPYTDLEVSIDYVISMYNAWRYNTPM